MVEFLRPVQSGHVQQAKTSACVYPKRPANCAGHGVGVARTPAQAIPLSGSYWGDGEDELGMEVMVNVKTTDDSMGESPLARGR